MQTWTHSAPSLTCRQLEGIPFVEVAACLWASDVACEEWPMCWCLNPQAWMHYLSGNFSAAMLAQVPAAGLCIPCQPAGYSQSWNFIPNLYILIKYHFPFLEVSWDSWVPLCALSDYIHVKVTETCCGSGVWTAVLEPIIPTVSEIIFYFCSWCKLHGWRA